MKVAVFSDLHTFQPDYSIVSKMSYQHFLNFCFYGNISSQLAICMPFIILLPTFTYYLLFFHISALLLFMFPLTSLLAPGFEEFGCLHTSNSRVNIYKDGAHASPGLGSSPLSSPTSSLIKTFVVTCNFVQCNLACFQISLEVSVLTHNGIAFLGVVTKKHNSSSYGSVLDSYRNYFLLSTLLFASSRIFIFIFSSNILKMKGGKKALHL